MLQLCEYGCGQEVKYQFKNGKWCCSNHWTQCPEIRKNKVPWNKGKKNSQIPWNKGKKGLQVPWNKGKSGLCIAWNKGKSGYLSKESLKKMTFKGKNNPGYGKPSPNRYTIKNLKNKYPFFSKIEEIRYNPDKLEKKEIQVHCKNHNCKNSKEKGGWFTPTKIQLYERIRQLEKDYGNDGCYFYCSEACKNKCPLYYLRNDPLKNNDLQYSPGELQIFREFVLERDNYICQFCGEKATDVHHERPQKLEPFFALDPDYAWSCCKKCHYKKGHIDECSTGALASKRCIK